MGPLQRTPPTLLPYPGSLTQGTLFLTITTCHAYNKIINPIASLTYFVFYLAIIQCNAHMVSPEKVKFHIDKEILNTVC